MPPQIEIRRQVVNQAKSVVVKVGTRVITTDTGILDCNRIRCLAAQLCQIADTERQTLLVSSGAVGAGVAKLHLAERPSGLSQLQAVAAIGQTNLIQAYEAAFADHGRHAAQVLLTASDLRRRGGYLNVRNSLNQIDASARPSAVLIGTRPSLASAFAIGSKAQCPFTITVVAS